MQYLRHGRCHMREGAGAQPASKTAYQAAFSRHPQQLLGAHLIEGDVSHPDLRHRAESRAEADIDIMAGVLETQVRLACIVIYRAGDFFFETGDISRRVNNKTSEPDTHLLFEVLPVDLKGPSLILPRDKPLR